MKAYKNKVTIPGAWVVSPEDRGRKSIKGDKVYLNDGEEFMIELYNPTQNTVLANIKLDGKPISYSGIVIYPGQRVYLDHFPETRKKFTFTTYEVSDDKESTDATAVNGRLEVNFHKEEVAQMYTNWATRKIYVPDPWVTQPYNPYRPYQPDIPYTPRPIWYGTDVSTCNTSEHTNFTRFKSELDRIGLSYEEKGSSLIVHDTGTPNISDRVTRLFHQTCFDTGITTGGEQTEQKLTEVDMDFQATVLSQTILQLLPESRRPYTPKKPKKNPKVDSDHFDGPHRELVQVEKLKDMGYITLEEYNRARKGILRRIIG